MTSRAPELPGLRFERVLGSGGYADVFLYRQQLPQRWVAVKVLKDATLADTRRRQFTAEANAMAGLADHPHIVPVFSAAVGPDGRPYIMMMFYADSNLAVRAAAERLPVAEVLRIGIQIASAVETAHRAGILHRDIKPANLLVSQYGTPGLADFGVAGQVAALEDDPDLGVSVPWAPPEALYATSPMSAASDVYSLAATLWHLLVGRSPFEEPDGDNSSFALMRRARDVPPPATGRRDVPDSLDRLLQQAMAKDPEARTSTAIDLARGLQAIEQELQLPRTQIVVTSERARSAPRPSPEPMLAPTVARAVTASQPPPVHRDEPDPGRRRAALLIGGIVLVAAAAVAGILIFWQPGSDGGGNTQPAQGRTVGGNTVRNLGNSGAPGAPQITGTRTSQGAIMYRWTYTGRKSGDTYQWKEVGSTRRGTVPVPSLTLPKSPTGKHCIRVRVIRANGADAHTRFSPVGCGR